MRFVGCTRQLIDVVDLAKKVNKKFEELEAKIKELEAKNVKKLPNKKAA